MNRSGRWMLLPLALAAAPAFGQTIINLASIPVFFACLAQERDLREEFMAELRSKNPEEAAEGKWQRMLVESPWSACLRKKNWVSKAYCADLVEASVKGTRPDVARVMQKHWAEYQGL